MLRQKGERPGAAVAWMEVPDTSGLSAERDRSASEGTVGELVRGFSNNDMRFGSKRSTIGPMPSTPSSGTPVSGMWAGQWAGKCQSLAMNADEKLQVLQYENQDLSDHVASLEGKLRQKVREVEVLQEKANEHEVNLRVLEQKLDDAKMSRKMPRDATRRAVTESAKDMAGALAHARQQEDENGEIREQLADMEEAFEASKAENERLCAGLLRSEQLIAKLREEVAEERTRSEQLSAKLHEETAQGRTRRLEAEQTLQNEREILREAQDEIRYLQEELQEMRFRAADGKVVFGHQKSVAALKDSNDSQDSRRKKKLVTYNLFSQMEDFERSDTEVESMATESVCNDAEDKVKDMPSGPRAADLDEPEAEHHLILQKIEEEAACREAELTQTINDLRLRLALMEKMAAGWKRQANETWWQRMSQHLCTSRPMDARESNVSMVVTRSSARRSASHPPQKQLQAATPS